MQILHARDRATQVRAADGGLTLGRDFYTLAVAFERLARCFSMLFSGLRLRLSNPQWNRVIERIAGGAGFRHKSVVEWRHGAALAAALLVLFLLNACAVSPIGDDRGAPANRSARRDAVAKRVMERWEALIKGDFQAAYAFMSPASRKTVSLEQFMANLRKDSYRKVEIERVDCGEDACVVKLWLTFDHPQMKGLRSPVEEIWVFDHGESWFMYRG